MQNDVTLKDIATALDVSMTTVHRAIHNKEGIGESVRASVLQKAKELGYTTNYVASSLKRRAIEVAVVLPSESGTGQYYHHYFWEAVRACETEANSLNVHISYYSFQEPTENQIDVLERVFSEHEGALDGLLTMPAQHDEAMRRAIERFTYSGVSVVLIDNDIPNSGRLCCVAPHDTLTGRLGAEVLASMTSHPGKILVAGGYAGSASHVHNLRGFSAYLQEAGAQLEPLVISGYPDMQKTYDLAVNCLKNDPDIVAFYSVTARETIPICQAVIDCGFAGKLRGVGSDLYPESAQLLRDNVVQALIYKNAYDKGEKGFRILFSYLVKKLEPPANSVTVPISVIMKNNLTFFQDRI